MTDAAGSALPGAGVVRSEQGSRRTRMYCVIVNYNYARFVLEHIDAWSRLRETLDGIVLVDDQSPDDRVNLQQVAEAGIDVISTTAAKSPYNALNQIEAIFTGVQKLAPAEQDIVWVVDADDWPNSEEFDRDYLLERFKPGTRILFCSRQDVYCSDRGDTATSRVRPERRHRFWVSGATTSSIMVRGGLLAEFEALLRSRAPLFSDVWYDVRVSALARSGNHAICDQAVCCRGLHGENDSMRYTGKSFDTYLRILKSMVFSVFSKIARGRRADS